jgi:hypothetical protein
LTGARAQEETVARAHIVRPYLEKVLCKLFDLKSPKTDDDGNYSFRSGSAVFNVRLLDEDPPVVSLFSFVLRGVRKSPKLLDALNGINSELRFVRVFWTEGNVIAAMELLADTLEEAALQNACATLASIADHFDTELKASFGGKTAFPDTPGEEQPADV